MRRYDDGSRLLLGTYEIAKVFKMPLSGEFRIPVFRIEEKDGIDTSVVWGCTGLAGYCSPQSVVQLTDEERVVLIGIAQRAVGKVIAYGKFIKSISTR
ncbi:unnamed protein product, partial [Mycena citricolor]